MLFSTNTPQPLASATFTPSATPTNLPTLPPIYSPTPLTTMHLYPIDGAAGRVGKDETAWPNRDAVWAQVIVGIDPDPANKDALTQWARSYWNEMEPFSMAGAYVNFLMGDEGEQRVRATYGESYDRLASIKAKYDPTNFFRVNQNIRPGK